ncbi:MAG: tetratricopeptide repeat protein [Syntrophobacteraceae bacterium]
MNTPNSLIGRLIDQFRLDKFIAKGAMGMVFKAFDTVLVRTVALKLISKKIDEDLTEEESTIREEARKRLIQEAKAAGRLNHPNILTIYSYGETEDFEYICMEYVTGKTLSQILQERRVIDPAEAIDIGDQILQALEAANREQIVHRDIKPSNIMITDDGRLKVMDFGIAKLPSFSMTTTGTVLGTPYYMSPEQISGQKVDIRSDLFSTGAVLYQILTGERPFEATNTATLAYKIVQVEPVPPDVLNIHIPHPLGAIVKKALTKNPNHRYQTPAEMLKALHTIRQEEEARGSSTADATVKFSVSDADATIQAQRPDGHVTAPPVPDDYSADHQQERAAAAEEVPASLPKIRLVPAQPDTDEGPEDSDQATVMAMPEPPPMDDRKTEPGSPQDEKPQTTPPDRSAPPEDEHKGVVPASRTVKHASKPTPSVPGSIKTARPAPAPRGGKYALAAVLCLALVGAGFLVNSLLRGKGQTVPPPTREAEQAGQKTGSETGSPTTQAKSSSQAPSSPSASKPTVESLLLQVKSRQWENDPVQAQKVLEEAVALDPNHFEANFQLARVLTHRQEYPRAIEVYKRALALNNQAPEVFFNLGYIYLNQGSYDAAIENYEACWALHPSYQDEVLTNLGIAYLKKNQADRAQQLFQQALDINPSNFVARSYMRGSSGPGTPSQQPPPSGTPAESVASGDKAVPQAAQRAASLVEEAKGLIQSNPTSAGKLLREAITLDPNSFEAHLQLGRLYTFQKNFDTAIGHYEKALRLNEQTPDAYFNLGFIYMTQKQYDRAIQSYEACLGLKPPYTDEVLTNLGISYLRKSSPSQARTLFQEALDWNPKNEIARNYIAQLDKAQDTPGSPQATGARPAQQEASLVEGDYSVAGVNPGGSPYEGTASIKRSGDRYNVNWQIGSDAFTGTGTLVGDTLTVNWKDGGGGAGLVIYTMTTEGVLKGVWAGGKGSETLTPAQ